MKSQSKKSILTLIVTSLMLLSLYSCSKNQDSRKPSSLDHYISAQMLKELGPLGLIEVLEEECCRPFVLESIDTTDWISEDDISVLKQYASSNQKSSPIVSVHSSNPCITEKYTSTLSNEAKHLLLSLRTKKYPVSMCSTYDLDLDN